MRNPDYPGCAFRMLRPHVFGFRQTIQIRNMLPPPLVMRRANGSS
jgi:hypothetical protein